MKKLIFEKETGYGWNPKKLMNGDEIFGEWKTRERDSNHKETIGYNGNTVEVVVDVYERSGWGFLDYCDFDADFMHYANSSLYHIKEGRNCLFLQCKSVTHYPAGDDYPKKPMEYFHQPCLQEVEGVEECKECCGRGFKILDVEKTENL